MRRLLTVGLAALVALAGCGWSQFRGTATHSGVNPFAPGITSANVATLVPAWTSAGHALLGSDVVTRDGRAFAAGANALWAVDLATGSDLWHRDRILGHQSNTLSSPTTWNNDGSTVVAMSQFWLDASGPPPTAISAYGGVDYLNIATGAPIGSASDGSVPPPLEAGGWLYSPHDIDVTGIHAEQHVHDLVASPGGTGGSPFTVHFGSLITDLASDGTNLHVVSAGLIASIPLTGCGQPTCTPVWSDNNANVFASMGSGPRGLYTLGTDNTVRAFANGGCGASTCNPLWTATVGGPRGGLAVTKDRLYITTGSTLSVFDAAGCGAPTCSALWTSTVGGTLSAPSIANDVVYAGSTDGTLNTWNTADCGQATCPTLWSQAQGGAVGAVSPIGSAIVFPVAGALRKLALPA